MKLPKELRFNYDDYCRMPDNGKRYEIIDGDLHNHPAPVIRHQRIIRKLAIILNEHIIQNDLGEIFFAPTDIILSYEDIVQPDIVFISKEREKIITDKNVQGCPDLIIEVISPGTEDYDRITKKRLYVKYRIEEYWVIDPDKKKFEVYRLRGNIYNKIPSSLLLENLVIEERAIFG